MSDAVAEQASSLEETAQHGRSNRYARQYGKESAQSQNLTKESVEEASRGESLAKDLSSSMKELENTTANLQSIVSYIDDIAEKTQAINDIVFQTRILSFNASIESERAGEHGRGFSVVAEEVGKLAAMSGQTSSQIRSIVDEARVKVSETVAVTKDRILRGRQVTEQFSKTFNTIAAKLKEIDVSVKSIADATSDQQAGVAQINEALNQIDSATQSNSAGAVKLAGSASTLLAASANMDAAVSEGLALVKKSETSEISQTKSPDLEGPSAIKP